MRCQNTSKYTIKIEQKYIIIILCAENQHCKIVKILLADQLFPSASWIRPNPDLGNKNRVSGCRSAV